mgnify:CR=1 FL=1
MPFTLLKPSGIDLSQTFAFTGSVTGAGGGKVLQTISSNNAYTTSNTSTSQTDILSASGTTWEIAITPSATSSKILFMCSLSLHSVNSGTSSDQESRGSFHIYEKIGGGSYSRFVHDYESLGVYSYDGNGVWMITDMAKQIMRSPSTTSEVKYKFQINCLNGTGTVACNETYKSSDCVLMEIGA